MHAAFVSTYPPRPCGLATFTQDLRAAVAAQPGIASAEVTALVRGGLGVAPPPEVAGAIRQETMRDYAAAAEYLNHSAAEVVCVQHEFGIFGGPEGLYVVDFLERLRKPTIATLHTVLPDPEPAYHEALSAVADGVDGLVVMTVTAREILRDRYGIDPARVDVIPHGVPDLAFGPTAPHKERLGLAGRTVLLTFGLLGPSKGIEFALDALPDVVAAHPDVLYLVLGATHPEVRRRDGEAYRASLQAQARAAGLEEHVRFVDRYVELDELCRYLQAADVYASPYPSMDQICSGTLAYAVGAGCAVVSTPYLHARELLADGRGRLVDHGDCAGLTRTLSDLVGNPEAREAQRRRAYRHGRATTWGRVGARYAEAFGRVRQEQLAAAAARGNAVRIPVPAADLGHLAALTDATGIVQHAAFGIPDRRHGYCTDDAARALVMALWYHRRRPSASEADAPADADALRLADVYLSFLHHAQQASGAFHNFMSYDRRFLDETGSQDTVGRALWGLGAAVAWSPLEARRVLARQMMERALDVPLHHPRAIAYAMCGLDGLLKRYPGAASAHRHLRRHADALADAAERLATDGWPWFHEDITYANAKLPEAMLLAYAHTGEDRYRRVGLATLDFLLEQTYREGRFDFVGNRGWYGLNRPRAVYDQQPIEAGYAAEACLTAFRITGDAAYARDARAAVEWFFGRNRLGARLYEPATGRCLDGLAEVGPNLNQGAESAIVCLQALLVAEELGELEPDIGVAVARPMKARRRA